MLEEKNAGIQDNNSGNEENQIAVNEGIQLKFELENEKSNTNILLNNFENVIFIGKEGGNKKRRGSPLTIRN